MVQTGSAETLVSCIKIMTQGKNPKVVGQHLLIIMDKTLLLYFSVSMRMANCVTEFV
jgi:hypothetical protein